MRRYDAVVDTPYCGPLVGPCGVLCPCLGGQPSGSVPLGPSRRGGRGGRVGGPRPSLHRRRVRPQRCARDRHLRSLTGADRGGEAERQVDALAKQCPSSKQRASRGRRRRGRRQCDVSGRGGRWTASFRHPSEAAPFFARPWRLDIIRREHRGRGTVPGPRPQGCRSIAVHPHLPALARARARRPCWR